MEINEQSTPKFFLSYPNHLSDYIDSSKLDIQILNSNIIDFNRRNLLITGKNKGETKIIFTYESIHKDTMYVSIGGGGNPFTQNIQNNFVQNNLQICTKSVINVPFNINGGIFNSENTFRAQLSNQFGENFQFVETKVNGSNLQVRIPEGLPTSSGYKLRIYSSSPAVSSNEVVNLTVTNQDNLAISSISNGSWPEPIIWSCSKVPSVLDNIIIAPGHVISVPSGEFQVKSIINNGTINLQQGGIIKINN